MKDFNSAQMLAMIAKMGKMSNLKLSVIHLSKNDDIDVNIGEGYKNNFQQFCSNPNLNQLTNREFVSQIQIALGLKKVKCLCCDQEFIMSKDVDLTQKPCLEDHICEDCIDSYIVCEHCEKLHKSNEIHECEEMLEFEHESMIYELSKCAIE